MNEYETIMIMNAEITDEQRNEVFCKIKKYITDNGNITNVNTLGLRKLAYEIRKHSQGYYYLIEFEAENNVIPELERLYRITDEVLKFIVVRKDN